MKKSNAEPTFILDLCHGGRAVKCARSIFSHHFPANDFRAIEKLYKTVDGLYAGAFPGYRACNTQYHDMAHVDEVFLAAMRLMDGCVLNGRSLSLGMALNILRAALLHDSGFIQEDWDDEGTGAKHSHCSAWRSVLFVEKNYRDLGIPEDDATVVARLIRSTDYREDFKSIAFAADEEMFAGRIVGTADLLGQMSSRVYLEKLLFLYYEYREAGFDGYSTEFDIMYKTMGFYNFARARLSGVLDSAFIDMKSHFRSRHNINIDLYSDAMEKNISYLRSIIDDSTTNFRHKLKRGNLILADRPA
jgi:hypothetical protein